MAISIPGFRLTDDSSRKRVGIVVPFILISAALLVLAFRSYQLSVRMERGLDTLAIQYLDYAAEITAQKSNAAARAEMFRVSEQWQQIERGHAPSYDSLNGWVEANPWIVTAIYIPDDDPTAAIFASEPSHEADKQQHLASEFYTASGSVRYTYDPLRLLQVSAGSVLAHPLAGSAHMSEARELREQSQVKLVRYGGVSGLVKRDSGPAVIAPLAAPLNAFAIEAALHTAFVSAGWHSHRVMSLWFAALAVAMVAVGTYFALRGLRKETEAMQLRTALIANVSHELRTPLSMIRLAAETLKRSTKLTPKERTDMEESILREVLHLSHLVENVLDVARLQKSAKKVIFSTVDPVQLVRSVVQNYESWITNKGFVVDLDLDLSIPEQMWDREGLGRALVNLIDNAMKYSQPGTRIRVSVQQTPTSVTIGVQDQGIGIKPQDIQRIFEPYFRAEFSDTQTKRGAGLGLTLVQQIVNTHNGRVEVESVPGAGSTFRLVLPRRDVAEQALVGANPARIG